jgi:hypothetical protein
MWWNSYGDNQFLYKNIKAPELSKQQPSNTSPNKEDYIYVEGYNDFRLLKLCGGFVYNS